MVQVPRRRAAVLVLDVLGVAIASTASTTLLAFIVGGAGPAHTMPLGIYVGCVVFLVPVCFFWAFLWAWRRYPPRFRLRPALVMGSGVALLIVISLMALPAVLDLLA